jgi:hypothetical protein
MSVQCTNTPEPGFDATYSVDLVGERDPAAVHGVGLTYDVDDVAFNEWIALNVDLAPNVKIVTQAEIDSWSDVNNKYGYELGLEVESGGTLAAEGARLGPIDVSGEAEKARTASLRHRMAEVSLRQAEAARVAAETVVETAKAERDIAEASARDAAAAAAEAQEAIRQPPPPPERRADEQPAQAQPQREA